LYSSPTAEIDLFNNPKTVNDTNERILGKKKVEVPHSTNYEYGKGTLLS
jgi:hypothetical protein